MWRRKKGNGSNSDGQSTENCIVMGMRVFGDFHIIIKYIATPLHEYDYYYHIYYLTSFGRVVSQRALQSVFNLPAIAVNDATRIMVFARRFYI